MPSIEILEATGSAALIVDEDLAKFLLPHKANGLLNVYLGQGLRDSTKFYIFLTWESYEHHENLAKDPAMKAQFQALLVPAFTGTDKPTVRNIDSSNDYHAALEAPVTEIAFLELKPDLPQEQIDTLDQAFVRVVNGAVGAHRPGSHDIGRGTSEGIYGVFIGWDSLEAHAANAAQIGPEFLAILNASSQRSSLNFSNLKKIL